MVDYIEVPSKRRLKEVFDECCSGDDLLDKEEFKRVCYRFYLDPTDGKVDDLFKRLDKNKDKKLTFEEVDGLIDILWTTQDERKEAFQADFRECRQKSGPIGINELREILTSGDNDVLSNEDVEYIFQKLDLNGDKEISEEELTNLLYPSDMARTVSRRAPRKSRNKSRSRSRSKSGERKKSRSGSRGSKRSRSRESKRSRSRSGERKGSRSGSRGSKRGGSRESKRSRSKSSESKRSRSGSRDSKHSGSGKRPDTAGSHRSGSGHKSRNESRQGVVEEVNGETEHTEQENIANNEQQAESLNQEAKEDDNQQKSSEQNEDDNSEQKDDTSAQKENNNSEQKDETSAQKDEAGDQTNEQKDDAENKEQKTDDQQADS